MRRAVLLALALTFASPALAQTAPSEAERATRWQEQVAILSSDEMEGRAAGTPGHMRAIEHIVGELRRLGLEPAGTEGFLQPIRFIEQRFDPAASTATLVAGGNGQAVALPAMATVQAGRPIPERVDAPLVFTGFGLHIPDAGHDDLAGLDLTGKIVVYASGRPQGLPANAVSSALATRLRTYAERGAVGAIALGGPTATPEAWARATATARPGIYAADQATPFLDMAWNPAENERLFAGSGASFAGLLAVARAGQPLPRIEIDARLTGTFAATRSAIVTPNVVARLPGSDPALRDEYIVMTAHTDGYGIGEPVNGDAIYNGALDNAAGTAALIDIAEQLKAQRPRRSILFAFVTAEEKGLLGSRYFVRNPTVPREAIVANLNYDMALPLYPLTSVTVLGAEESSIGRDAQAVGTAMNLPLAPDPFPERNSFIRSDQFAFIEAGIPAVAFKFGFAAGTPEAETERAFRAERYHQPSDDMTTRIFSEDEIRLHDFIAALALRIANAEGRPAWNEGSRFATPAR